MTRFPIAFAALLLLLSACKKVGPGETGQSVAASDSDAQTVEDPGPAKWLVDHEFTDPDTGCQYLFTDQGGITARLNRQGQPMCDHTDTSVEDNRSSADTSNPS